MTRPTWDASEHDPDAKHDERGHGGDRTDRDAIEYEPNPNERGTWLSAVVGLLGLSVLVQAVALDLVASQFWNAVLVGTALLVLGAYNAYRRSNRELGSAGVATFAALVGLWLVASPFLLGSEPGLVAATNEVGAWISVGVGLLAFGLGTYSAATVRKRRRNADARATAVYDRRGQ